MIGKGSVVRKAIRSICLLALFAWTPFVDHADACSIVFLPTLLPPEPDAVRIAGVITGYGTAVRPIPRVESAPTLYVRVEDVVSGSVGRGDAEIVLLFYEADCRSRPFDRKELESLFPIGSPVVVYGVENWVRTGGRPTVMAEMNSGAYVGRVPQGVPRTRYGDLDFERLDATTAQTNYQFAQFEFDRVILTLPRTGASEKVSRLKNLAYYYALPYIDNARDFYEQLVSTSRVPEAQGRALRENFDRVLRQPR